MSENRPGHVPAYVYQRITYLNALKTPFAYRYERYKDRYRTWGTKTFSKIKSDYKSNIWNAIINQKKSEVLHWVQEYDFIPLDNEAAVNLPLIKRFWDYKWMTTKTDEVFRKVLNDCLTFWTWFQYEWVRTIRREVKNPYKNKDWTLEFRKETITEEDWIYTRHIPWNRVFLDWRSLVESNELIWLDVWDRDLYIEMNKNNPWYNFKSEDIPLSIHDYWLDWADIYINYARDNGNEIDYNNLVAELHYYNKALDEYIVLANNHWVNPVPIKDESHIQSEREEVEKQWLGIMPIPFKHKELPICVMTDHELFDTIYAMWEYELADSLFTLRDNLRNIITDWAIYQFWFTAISPGADFDASALKMWPWEYYRIDRDDVNHFNPNIQTSQVAELEAKVDRDIKILLWIDFDSQFLSPEEKRDWENRSNEKNLRKRISLFLKQNSESYFWRLAKLRLANMQDSEPTQTIPTKGEEIWKNFSATPIEWGYWLFTIKPEMLKGKFSLVPITDSILGESDQFRKAQDLEYAQFMLNLVNPDWSRPVPIDRIVEIVAPHFDKNPQNLLWDSELVKKPEELIDEHLEKLGLWWEAVNNTAEESIVPASQRSANPNGLSGSVLWQLNQEQ